MRPTMQRGLVVFLLVIIGIVAIAAVVLVSSVRSVMQPAADLSSNLATQVSQLMNPTPTILPDPVTIIHEMRALSRLETMQYSVEKVITAESGAGIFDFLFSNRLLLVAHGEVIAGVDLGKLEDDSIQVGADGSVTIELPHAEVFISALDSEKTYVYDRDGGLLRDAEVGLESAARLKAEEEFERAAVEDGILDQAQVNAESFLYRFLRSVGLRNVTFTTAPAATPTPSGG
jgi:hypothetical protein